MHEVYDLPRPEHRGTRDQLGHQDHNVHAAIRFAVLSLALAVSFILIGAVWVSTCNGAADLDTVACGAPQRTMLGLGGPLILLVAGLWAFLRTYRVWKSDGTWWAWQGAGWFLFTAMLFALATGLPAIAGPALNW